MKTSFWVIAAIFCGAMQPAHAAVVIAGSTGNGDFEATEPAASGDENFSETPFWYNADGTESSTCTSDGGTGGSPQPDSRAAVLSTDQAINVTGHTVGSAGETFSVELSLHTFGGGYNGDETARISLFTASAPVDENLATSNLTEVGHITYNVDSSWVDHPATSFYSTAAADVGETLYLGMRLLNPSGNAVKPRLDVLQLTVAGTGGNSPPSFSGSPINKPDGDEGVAYIGSTLAGTATDPESDPLTFAKAFGPAWISVAPDGTLSGTPGGADAGTNTFTVQVTALGGSDTAALNIYVVPVPVILTGWEEFVVTYGLSGAKFADFDGDEVLDVFEFAHGGDPTNSADRGNPPYIEPGTNDMVSFISLETTHTNPGITYTAEWTDSLMDHTLLTNTWDTAWAASNSSPSAIPGYDAVERKVSSASDDELFFRNRLFDFRPNILVILADDLGYSDVGFNGSPDIITPELDSLATNGTIFTSAYVVHPFCGPSRMGLFSGRYPHEYGGPYNLPNFSSGQYTEHGISTNDTLISTVLQDAGYYTGIMGKWHMGQQAYHHPNNRGFDDFYGFLGGGHNYFGPYGFASDYRTYPEHNGVDDESLTSTNYMTDVLSSHGVRFLNEAATRGDPFFLFMSYNAPHTPLTAKAEDLAVFPGIPAGKRKTYAAMVYAMDRGVGELVDALKANGQLETTLVIFLSDNGGRTDQGATNDPLRGRKGDVAEGGFRVPMFMHWPGVIAAGGQYDHPVSAIDFYPTFARLGKATLPAGKEIDGVDVWDAILAGTSGRVGEPIYTLRHNAGYGTTGEHSVGIRKDQWKATRWTGFPTMTWKLFNIETDIHEDVDLSATYPTILSNMVAEAELWSQSHILPLWYDDYDQEQMWIDRGLPHYDDVFSLP